MYVIFSLVSTMIATAVLFVALSSFAAAKPTGHSLVVRDRRSVAPQGFAAAGPAAKDAVLNFRIGLLSNNIAGLEKALYDVSTPSSALYGKHLSVEEVCLRHVKITTLHC